MFRYLGVFCRYEHKLASLLTHVDAACRLATYTERPIHLKLDKIERMFSLSFYFNSTKYVIPKGYTFLRAHLSFGSAVANGG